MQRLRGMHSRFLVSGLPRSLPPLPPSPAPPCLPCVEGRQRATPHSSAFPPTEAPLQTLHMDLNLWPRVSAPETLPTLRWTGEVGDASVFRVWGSRAFVRDTSADKLSSRAVPCVFLGFVPDAPGWQFYRPTSRRVFPSQDVTFDESVPFYRLFPYRTAPLPPPPLFLTLGAASIDPLPPQGPAPSGVSQVDPVEPAKVAVDSGPARGTERAEPGGAEPRGAETGGTEPGGAGTGGAEPGGAETEGTEPGGAETTGAEPGGAVPGGAEPGGAVPGGAEPGGPEPGGAAPGGALSSQQLREWYSRYCRRRRGAVGAGGATGAGPEGAGPTGVGVAADPGVGAGDAGATGPGGARTGDTGAAGTVGATGAAGGVTGIGAGGAAGAGAGGADARPPAGARADGAAGAGATGGTGVGTTGAAGGTAGVGVAAGGSGVVSAVSGSTSRPRLYFRVPLPSPPTSSLPALADPESDSLRAASPTVTRLLATAATDPSFESAAASALVAELVDFAAHYRLDYAASLVAESESVCPPSVGDECALGTDVLEDRQEEFECFAAAVPHLVSMLIAPEGDPDAPDIPTPRSYAEAIAGEYSSQWQSAMDAEMASWKSTGTYVNEVPPPGANIVSGMWIFRVKRPPGSPPVFKARYVARGFSQREGVDFFQTFSPTPKMTTLRVLLHVAAQRDYELHSLDFSTAFLQGSLHEEIWLRRPPGFTGSFPPGTQWSLRRPVYGLHQAPREWHDTLRTTLAALGFAPSTADPSLFLRTDTSLPPFYILVYVDDLVFATADTEALALFV
ncbi:unnamed protein product [Closterium sp. Naga37s-1]|nr:unnamed protein product [Closterium sp. Naga37s-1]